jgi:hypothetical protein
MIAPIAASLVLFLLGFGSAQVKRIARLESGPCVGPDGRVVCFDSDHNDLEELVFFTGTIRPSDPLRWEVWEYRPTNRFELVYADTGAYPSPPGITTGNMLIYDGGDVDRDGRMELLGEVEERLADGYYWVVATIESRDSLSFPDTLTWYSRCTGSNTTPLYDFQLADLDQDGRCDILHPARWDDGGGIRVEENRGDNQNELVWQLSHDASSFAVGDFDHDGIGEFATGTHGSAGYVYVFKSTAPDSYPQVFRDSLMIPNGSDVFAGRRLDSAGLSGFFVAPAVNPGRYCLYLFTATGNNTYRHTLVAEKWLSTLSNSRRSRCGDIDGDGIDEVIWTLPTAVFVFKSAGGDSFEEIWQWYSDHGTLEYLTSNVHDVNHDGYNEIVVGGSRKVSVFEVEAVRVDRPNGGEVYASGDTHYIRWQTFTPPRCDSLSVWFSSDRGRNYALVAQGLALGVESIPWQVPGVLSDSCLAKVVAYGPGTTFDESDSCFRIVAAGATEGPAEQVPAVTKLVGAFPNPARDQASIRFQLNSAGRVGLRVRDVSGRVVADLVDGNCKPGFYEVTWDATDNRHRLLPKGVYFAELAAPNYSERRKVVLVR